jgi:hypothetical protein
MRKRVAGNEATAGEKGSAMPRWSGAVRSQPHAPMSRTTKTPHGDRGHAIAQQDAKMGTYGRRCRGRRKFKWGATFWRTCVSPVGVVNMPASLMGRFGSGSNPMALGLAPEDSVVPLRGFFCFASPSSPRGESNAVRVCSPNKRAATPGVATESRGTKPRFHPA